MRCIERVPELVNTRTGSKQIACNVLANTAVYTARETIQPLAVKRPLQPPRGVKNTLNMSALSISAMTTMPSDEDRLAQMQQTLKHLQRRLEAVDKKAEQVKQESTKLILVSYNACAPDAEGTHVEQPLRPNKEHQYLMLPEAIKATCQLFSSKQTLASDVCVK